MWGKVERKEWGFLVWLVRGDIIEEIRFAGSNLEVKIVEIFNFGGVFELMNGLVFLKWVFLWGKIFWD